MKIEKSTILYFTGTGNSLNVAMELENKLEGVKLQSISSLVDEETIEVDCKFVGIVFPVYYARLPLMVEKVIEKLKISKNTYVFAIATHGGGPAEVLKKLDKIIRGAGNTLNASFLVNMPANNIFAYNGPSLKKQNKILKNANIKIEEIAYMVRGQVNRSPEKSRLIIDTFIDRVTTNITDKIMMELHLSDEKFTVDESCNSCKVCSMVCPASNIDIVDTKPVWKHKCEKCAACIQHCPSRSINVGERTAKRKRYTNPNINLNHMIRK